MSIRSPRQIYNILERHLREAKRPLTCVKLMEIDEVRSQALAEFDPDVRKATEAVSNALGLMWRRNLLSRYPAPAEPGSGSMARFAYQWNEGRKNLREVPSPVKAPMRGGKTGFIITESDEGVMLEFEKFMVLIKPK